MLQRFDFRFLDQVAMGISLVKGKPIVVGRTFMLKNPYRVFPLSIRKEWPKVLSKIPVGWGLRVPVPRLAVANYVIPTLVKEGMIKPHEFVVREADQGECIIHHVSWLTGIPFRMKQPSLRFPHLPVGTWEETFERVASGRSANVRASMSAAYVAYHELVRHGKLPKRSFRFEKVVINGTEYVKIRKNIHEDWDTVFKKAASGQTIEVPASAVSARIAYHQRVAQGKLPKKLLRIEKIIINGVEFVRISKR
jgi:hypothetical protein